MGSFRACVDELYILVGLHEIVAAVFSDDTVDELDVGLGVDQCAVLPVVGGVAAKSRHHRKVTACDKNIWRPPKLGVKVELAKTQTLTKEDGHGSFYRNGCACSKLYLRGSGWTGNIYRGDGGWFPLLSDSLRCFFSSRIVHLPNS